MDSCHSRRLNIRTLGGHLPTKHTHIHPQHTPQAAALGPVAGEAVAAAVCCRAGARETGDGDRDESCWPMYPALDELALQADPPHGSAGSTTERERLGTSDVQARAIRKCFSHFFFLLRLSSVRTVVAALACLLYRTVIRD